MPNTDWETLTPPAAPSPAAGSANNSDSDWQTLTPPTAPAQAAAPAAPQDQGLGILEGEEQISKPITDFATGVVTGAGKMITNAVSAGTPRLAQSLFHALADPLLSKITGLKPEDIQKIPQNYLEPKNAAQSAGQIVTELTSLIYGNMLAEGAAPSEALADVTGIAKSLEKYPFIAKAARLGIDSLRSMGVGTANALLNGHPLPEAVKSGAEFGATVGTLGTLGEVANAPGVVGTIGKVAKTGTELGLAGQGAVTALTPKQPGETDEQYAARVTQGGAQAVLSAPGLIESGKEIGKTAADAPSKISDINTGRQFGKTPEEVAGKLTGATDEDRTAVVRAVTENNKGLIQDLQNIEPKKGAFKQASDTTRKYIEKEKANVDQFLASHPETYHADELKHEFQPTGGKGNAASNKEANFVTEALDSLLTYYENTTDPEGQARVQSLQNKLQFEGLNVSELNQIARDFGNVQSTFKDNGELKSGIDPQKKENIRSGIKDTIQGLLQDDPQKTFTKMDSNISDLINVEGLFKDMNLKAQKIENNSIKSGLPGEVANRVGKGLKLQLKEAFSNTDGIEGIEKKVPKLAKWLDKLSQMSPKDADTEISAGGPDNLLARAKPGQHVTGSMYTDEGIRQVFNIPPETSLKDLVKQGKLIKENGMYGIPEAKPVKPAENKVGLPVTTLQKPMGIPVSALPDGYRPRDVLEHELAHAVIGRIRGFNPEEIISHNHELADSNTGAMTVFDAADLGLNSNHSMPPQNIEKNLSKIIDLTMAGGAANEAYGKIHRELNNGLDGDNFMALRMLLKDVGMTPEEADDYMTESFNRVKKLLTNPDIQRIIQDAADTREEGLDSTLHYSKERVKEITDEALKAHESYSKANPESNPEISKAVNSGRKAEVKNQTSSKSAGLNISAKDALGK